MILFRVIAHMKAQSWTAIAIDYSTVVAGVFFGPILNEVRQGAALARDLGWTDGQRGAQPANGGDQW
jgi:hypothetical protein